MKTNNADPENHKVVSQKEWLAARLELLEAEKELTRKSDEVARKRQELPWTGIDREYEFKTEEGNLSLGGLFKGRSQLLIYHFMFGPDYTAGCPNCSAIADGFNGCAVHLANHDVMFWAVSRAPIENLLAYRKRMGWKFPWASSQGSDFNFDFHASFSEEQQRSGNMEYNYRDIGVTSRDNNIEGSQTVTEAGKKLAASVGTDWTTYIREAPGMSAFTFQHGKVFHTYSSYARGLDGLWATYQWLDRAPLGRNEKAPWFRRHDEYGPGSPSKGSSSNDCCS